MEARLERTSDRIGELARDHLSWAARRRLYLLTFELAETLKPSEYVELLSEAFMDDGEGLLAVTSARVLFLPLKGESDLAEVARGSADLGVSVEADVGGGISELVLHQGEDEAVIDLVGGAPWAYEVAAAITAGDADHRPGECLVCAEPWPLGLRRDAACPSCGIATSQAPAAGAPNNSVPRDNYGGDGCSGELVTYTLDEFTPAELSQLSTRLAEGSVEHLWEGVTLVTPARFEAHVDELLDEIEGPTSDIASRRVPVCPPSGRAAGGPRFVSDARVGTMTARRAADAACYLIAGLALLVLAREPELGWKTGLFGAGCLGYGSWIFATRKSYWVSTLVYVVSLFAVAWAIGAVR